MEELQKLKINRKIYYKAGGYWWPFNYNWLVSAIALVPTLGIYKLFANLHISYVMLLCISSFMLAEVAAMGILSYIFKNDVIQTTNYVFSELEKQMEKLNEEYETEIKNNDE